MPYTQDQILRAINSAESRGDLEKASRIRSRYGIPDPAAGAGLVSGIKGRFANLVGAVARPVEDLTGQPTALGQYADELRGALPQAYTGIESIAERPVAVVGELVGQQLPQLGATVGGAGVGGIVGGAVGGLVGKSPAAVQAGRRIGQAAGAFLPNFGMQYDEVRGRQEQTGEGTIPGALTAAAGGAALDTAFGVESLANKLVFGGAKDAARSRLKNAAVQAATQPLIEAPTEAAQAALGRLAAGQDLSSPEAYKEYLDNAAAAALVSAPIGGALGAIQRPDAPAVQPEQSPPPAPQEPEFEVPPAEVLLDPTDDYSQPEPEAVQPVVQPAPEAQAAPEAAPQVAPPAVEPPSAPKADPIEIGEGPGRSLANIVPSPEGDFELEGAIPRDESPIPEQFRPAVEAIDAQIEAAKSPVQRAKLIDTRNSFVDAILARQRPKPDPKELMLRDVASRPAVTPEQAQRRNASPPPKAKFQRAIPHPKVPGKFVFVTPEEADVLAPSAPKADLVAPRIDEGSKTQAADLFGQDASESAPAPVAEPVAPAVAATPEIPNAPVERQKPEVNGNPLVFEGLKEFGDAEADIKRLINRYPALKGANSSVGSGVNNTKILRSVVGLVPIDVINLLRGKELSTDYFLNNKSVFENSDPIYSDLLVSSGIVDGLSGRITRLGAETLSFLSARRDEKNNSTPVADFFYPGEVFWLNSGDGLKSGGFNVRLAEPFASSGTEPSSRSSVGFNKEDVGAEFAGDLIHSPILPEAGGGNRAVEGGEVQEGVAKQNKVEGLPVVEAPVDQITLSEDVPQFKSGAASGTGVVEPLTAKKFDRRGISPIQLWRRLDGRLEVISGRHRFDLAKRTGEKTIPAQIHNEADGFDKTKAGILDVELNIRDEQGKVADYANYFRAAGITEQEARDRGLLDRAKGRAGWTIANQASDDLIAAYRAGRLTDQEVVAIAEAAPNNAAVQAVGMRAISEDKSIGLAVNMMRAAMVARNSGVGGGEQGDIFGFDDSALREAERQAKVATAKEREIAEQINAVRGAARNPKRAAQLGVDVKDPDGLNKRLSELESDRERWKNWYKHPDLVAQVRGDEVAPVAEPVAEEAQDEGPSREEMEAAGQNVMFARGQGDMFGGPFAGGRAPERQLPASEQPENFRLVAQTRTEKQTDEELVRTAKAVQATLFQNRPEDVVAAVDKARKRLEKDIGKRAVANLEAQGTLLLVDSSEVPANLKRTMDAKTFAIFDADSATAYVMVDRVPSDRLKAIVTHEIGEHYALPGLLGGAGYGNMIQDVRRLIGSSTDAKFVAAVKHVRENYDLAETDINFAREVVARYAENPGGMDWWNRVVGTIREFLRELGVTVEMSEKDVAFLVGKALRAAGRGEIRYIQPEGAISTPSAEARAAVTESKAFKDWFGDSKVVDENGEPLVVYHGTNSVFDTFSKEKIGSETDTGYLGSGFYFSSDPSVADVYGKINVPVYLKAKNIYDMNGKNFKQVLDSHGGPKEFSDWLKSNGYDGATIWSQFMVLYPSQIKSAIGNNGNFNPASPNILEARGPQSPLPSQDTKDAMFGLLSRRSIIAKFVNRMGRWPEGQAWIEKQMGGKLRWDENVAAEAKRVPGKIKAAVDQFESSFVDPIVDGLRKAKITGEQFAEFNKLRHAKERNREIAKINAAKQDGGSGITNADADTRMAALMNSLNPAQRIAIERAGDTLVRMNARRLKIQLDAGLISQAEYDVLTQKYEFYVPLKSVQDESDEVDNAGVGGYVVRGGEYERALGRFSEADDPFIVSIMDYERAILRSEKKVPSDALWKLANNPDAKDLVTVFDPADAPEGFQVQKPRKVLQRDQSGKPIRTPQKDANGKVVMKNGKPVMQYVYKTEVVVGIDPNWSGSKNIIPVKVDGETKYVLVKDDVMASQFKNMDEQRLGDAIEMLNKATSLFGRFLTQFNPAFIPVNFFRDAFTVTYNSMSIPGVSPQKILRGIWPGIAAIRAERTGQPHPLANEYRQFIDDGASIGGLGLSTFEDQMRRIEEKGLSIKDANKTTARQAVGAVKRFAERVSKINEAIENSTRFSVYRHAKVVFEQNNLLMGMSVADANADARQRAANLAREISVDFNQRGEYSRMLNSFFVFFNAAIQGLASFNKFVWKDTPENRKAKMGLAVIGIAGIASRLVNTIVGDDDDLEEKKALAFESKAGINIPIAIGDTVVTLPLQYIYNIPFVVGYRMTDAALTGRLASNLGQILKTSFGALSPLGEPKVESASPASFVAKTFTPTLFTPILDFMDNTNSFGGPIAKQVGLFDKAPPPRAYDHWKSTTEVSVAISKFLNFASGGDQYRPGKIDLPPEWLDYLGSYYGGGPVRTIAQIGATAHALTDENEPLQLSKLPVVSRIITDQKPEWYVSRRYYDLAKEMAYVDSAMKDRQQVAPEDRRALPAFQDAEKLLRNLNKLRREAAAKNDATRERDYEMRIEDVQARAVRAYNLAHKDWETSFKGATPEELSGLARQQGKSKLADLLESVREP